MINILMDYLNSRTASRMNYIASVIIEDMMRMNRHRLVIHSKDMVLADFFVQYWNMYLVGLQLNKRVYNKHKELIEKMKKTDTVIEKGYEIKHMPGDWKVGLDSLVNQEGKSVPKLLEPSSQLFSGVQIQEQ